MNCRSPRSPCSTARTVAAIVLLVAAAAPAWADWSGKGEVGAVLASGNTETKSGNVKLGLTRVANAWTHKLGFAAVYGSDDIGTTAQRWEFVEQSNHQFNAHNFWFGGLRYEDNRFSGFDYQASLSTGLGHQFIDNEATTLSGQLGVGYKITKTSDSVDPLTSLLVQGERDRAVGAFANVDFRHAINPATTLLDKLTVETTSDNTFLQNEIGLEVKMWGKLALAVAFAVRHNTDPPAAFKKTDTLTTVNIVYETK